MKNTRPRPLALMILDGWGYRKDTEANAIAAAHKPNWDHLCHHYPHTLLSGSGQCVGLPNGQMGNSEVGHLNMGAGRIAYQDLTRIDLAINNGNFFDNKVLINAIRLAHDSKKSIHVMGLLSPGGVHSHEKHIHAIVTLAAKLGTHSLFIHAFLDGRDTPPRSAMPSIESLDAHCKKLKCGEIVSIIGRYFAMDRDKRWDRIHQAYNLMVEGKADYIAANPKQGLENAYARGESDEFVQATAIRPKETLPIKINDGDVLIFMNFRADRARELTSALIEPDFHGFKRDTFPQLGTFVCLSEYDNRFPVRVAFPSQLMENILAEYISKMGLKQLRIAETEKYAHVTFFFNGGVEHPYPGESRVLIPSPKIATYDMQPQMSALELTDRLVHEIKTQQYDLIVCNFANPDMVGHTGNFDATVKAIETIDGCLGKIIHALHEVGGELLITADHGNAEQMFDPKNNQPHTAHTCNPVPFIYLGRNATIIKEDGKLSDIAPTMLYLMGLPQPQEMTGSPLVKLV
ncbi:MAG: 2,3-bisphosphoglycerate-independent phosphoglycerate mutase [Gammaproteobacteria bacterium]|nr:2,3-bisphosphoglycerate-independent phosphoglycerate mutase [Gammaproteobacteria bacterium]MCW5583176.1 2,3-bisphosphoglycerate-independent phosphoglycerate mutase [Gammaproteobacteria bacterium]